MSVCVPAIVASVSYLGQTAAISTTTAYTVDTAGMYRLSAYIETSDTNSAHNVTVEFDYQDDVSSYTGRFQVTATGGASNGNNGKGIVQTLICAASSTIQFDTSSGSLASPYSLYITVEAL